jgi:predicted RNase H-like HicB family nuclease
MVKKEKIFYAIIHEAEEGGYWAECPSLKGCMTQGETIEEVKNNIKEAIELCLEEIKIRKGRIPIQRKIYLTPIAL